ncbi:MAG TPA: sigma 54-dependent Fis family transcriptional regulator [Halieaceae bacterium]|nr:sigma 54-dependent Fis family transcriptional regulator [Halieaceae bacterium]
MASTSKFAGKATLLVDQQGPEPTMQYNKFKLVVMEGPEAGKEYVLDKERVSIGSQADNDVVIPHETVSRHHCEILVDERGHRIRDLVSTNGTDVEGCRIVEGFLHPGARIGIGEVVLLFHLLQEKVEVPLSPYNSFGQMLGRSLRMRALFHLAERVSSRDTTVLISGETGTGKGLLAEEIHLHSPRHDKSLVVVDCSTIPTHLMESELFGHVKGAFTGAVATREGAFQQAHGGTIFFDEIGELPPPLQPKLLRVLEKREVKPVGQTSTVPVDVRIIAATNRYLKSEVAAGRFREDLFFRLSVFEFKLPPLRERKEDIPLLAKEFLRAICGDPKRRLGSDAIRYLSSHQWPGNVRELHNVIERAVHLVDDQTINAPSLMATSLTGVGPAPDSGSWGGRGKYSFVEAREMAEREYLIDLLRRHDFNVSAAAKTAGIHRQSLHRLLRKHKLSARELEQEASEA